MGSAMSEKSKVVQSLAHGDFCHCTSCIVVAKVGPILFLIVPPRIGLSGGLEARCCVSVGLGVRGCCIPRADWWS
eukprot:7925544-Heterocapsa_arctica.AAC.1